MLDYFQLEAAETPAAIMLWLHGLGADGYDLEPAAQMLATRTVRHVFAHAPVRPVTLNGGLAMRAWFDVAAPDVTRDEDSAGIRDSVREVGALARRLRAESGLPLVLAGFSQGAVVSLAAAVAGIPGLVGVAALSGYVPRFLVPELASLRGLPLFVAHGERDEVIPYALGAAGARALVEAGAAVDWHAYAMPHSICQAELQDLAAWLERLLPEASPAG